MLQTAALVDCSVKFPWSAAFGHATRRKMRKGRDRPMRYIIHELAVRNITTENDSPYNHDNEMNE
eukprot:5157181-Amphidinium_carterae.1